MLALIALLSASTVSPPLAAQDSKANPEPTRLHASFGSIVCGIGDADGDGVPDLLIGDTDERDGHVWLVSLAKEKSLYSTPGLGAGAVFTSAVCRVGDVDGDGPDDWMESGIDTRPRTELRLARMGLKRPDGTSFDSKEPSAPKRVTHAFLRSGKDGSVIRDFADGDPRAEIGRCACAVGDFDGDGHPDVALGCVRIGTQTAQTKAGPLVSIRSGKDGSELRTLGAFQSEGWRAVRVAALGDLDGDGTVDIAVLGEDAEDNNQILQIFSGKTGAELRRMLPLLHTDPAVLSVGDRDGDGAPDYLVGMTPCVEILSGKTGNVLLEMTQAPVLVATARKSTYCDDFGSAAVMLRERNSNVGAQFVVNSPNTAT